MKKAIVLILSCLVATTAIAKKKSVILKKPVTETSVVSASPEVVTSHESGASSFSPKDLFQGNNKSELFLSVTAASINTGSGNSNVSLAGMYTYLVKEQIQVGAQILLDSRTSKAGGSASTTDIFALGIYNFSPVINEAMFAFGGLGVGTMQISGKSESKGGFKVGAGKRFPIMANVQYVPMVWIQKLGEFDPVLNLMPVNFSLIF